ncbi:hypothetical protein BJX99DRAFT_262843 [Aspergillus californicus]
MANISALCLTYLLLDPFCNGLCGEQTSIPNLIESYPFVSYAARNWGEHVQEHEQAPLVWALAVQFLANHQATACSHQILQHGKAHREIYWTPKECYSVNALHMANNFGLNKLVVTFLSQNMFKMNATTTIGTTAAILAASAAMLPLSELYYKKVRSIPGELVRQCPPLGR